MTMSSSERQIATDWLVPWRPVVGSDASKLEGELHRELARGHPLYGRTHGARALAVRQDCDDVLFELRNPSQFAVVHLTYVKTPPDRPPWPDTEIFEDFGSFVAQMKEDHDDFTTEFSW
jgi:hypothetical protein